MPMSRAAFAIIAFGLSAAMVHVDAGRMNRKAKEGRQASTLVAGAEALDASPPQAGAAAASVDAAVKPVAAEATNGGGSLAASWWGAAQAQSVKIASSLAGTVSFNWPATAPKENAIPPLVLIAGMAVGMGALLGGLISVVVIRYQGNFGQNDRGPPRAASRPNTGRLMVAPPLSASHHLGTRSRAGTETDGGDSVCGTASCRSEVHMAWSTSPAEFQGLTKAQTAELLKIAHRSTQHSI